MIATHLLAGLLSSDFIDSFLYSFYFECPVGNEKPQRRGSVGSLDSGMSISYTSASTGSRDNAKVRLLQQPFQVSFSFEINKLFCRKFDSKQINFQ